MDLDEILSQKLTNDKTAEVVEENYRGLLSAGCERDPRQEKTIKLNKLERLMTPQKPDKVTTTRVFINQEIKVTKYYCPNCRAVFFSSKSVIALNQREVKHCDNCGQALDWSDISNDSESE